MSSIRTDPVTGRRVVVAAERASRPSEFEFGEAERIKPEHCPFCAGNEDATPEAIAEYPSGDDGWAVRVVPNKFPALEIDATYEEPSAAPFATREGFGAHEVVVESADHRARFTDLSVDEAALAVKAWRDRVADLGGDERLVCVVPFKNEGAPAGTTIEHVHSQIMATPFVPSRLRAELDGARRYAREHDGECVFCRLEQTYRDGHARRISVNEYVTVYAPFASRVPFELKIVPHRHRAHFGRADDAEIEAVGAALSDALGQLDRALDAPPLNTVVHTAPLQTDEDFHWHVEVLPAISRIAGFEWGAGTHVNSTSPEDAAEHLRALG